MKRFFAVVSVFVLTGYAFGADEILETELSGTAVDGYDPSKNITGFTVQTGGDSVMLKAWDKDGASGYIFKTKLSGTALDAFNPGSPICSLTVSTVSGWVIMTAHAQDGTSGQIIETRLSGTALQSYICSSGQAIHGFTVYTTGVWFPDGRGLRVTTGPVGIEEDKESGRQGEERLVTGLNVIAPNPCVGGYTRISYTVGTGYQALGTRHSALGEKQMTNDQCPMTISIYDLSGRLVTTLISKSQKSGRYSLSWRGVDDSGRKVATGIYFLRLTAGKFVEVRKLVVIR